MKKVLTRMSFGTLFPIFCLGTRLDGVAFRFCRFPLLRIVAFFIFWKRWLIVKNTLKQNYEFRRLYRRGKSAGSRHVVLYVRRNGLPVSRIGLTVTPKLGCAVTRNRVKRLLRAAWRSLQEELRPGFDVVIVARFACVSAKMPEVAASMRYAARGAGLLREGGSRQ